MKKLNSLRVEGKKIILDGQELKYVQAITIEARVTCTTVATIEVLVGDLEVNLDEAEVNLEEDNV